MLPTKFRFIWPSGFRGEDFLKSAIQKQELPITSKQIVLVLKHLITNKINNKNKTNINFIMKYFTQITHAKK